ncbi:zinc-dependent metalloprotease [Adhaeribacter sp. BT258]|uniref:Zinc-dependent metalloprotease n=1 Tax=Adhaeribacter terrigena TaxID=2793070 RepID=A0ABS1C1U1_9BACT|nr:T9SS type A sorting domain-containing protein [Adhaeribacter terrigena]MBK0403374.1 zinc-dependent metalloprotease [Adhaeribacter terrigena]
MQDVAAAFRTKYEAKESRGKLTDQQVQYKPEGAPALDLTISTSKKEAAATFYYGNVNGAENSTFYLKVLANEVSGAILMRESKKYFEFSSTSAGLVYLTEQDIDKKLCVDFESASQVSGTNARTGVGAVALLESLPGATAVVLLDFDGHTVSGTTWNSQFTSGNVITAAPANLTSVEILETWKLISEDFRPFALNITTNEAVFNNAPVNMRVRAVFTPTNYFFQNAGGVAYVGSFAWGGTAYGETPAFIFNTTSKYAGEAGSHEIGHALNLHHDGRANPIEEYYEGHADWAPIMGVGYYRDLVQWSKGDYPNANQYEDDLAVITTQNGFGYRPDDHGNTFGAATPIVLDSSGNIVAASNKGVISTRADIDVFSINLTGMPVTLTVDPEPIYGNLDVILTLKNAANVTVAQADPTTLGASVSGTFPAGTYYLHIDGTKGALGADTDYSSLGNYFISGAISNQFSLSVTINGNGTVTKNPDQATYAKGSTVTLKANPATGFQFSGWSGDTTTTANPLTLIMNSNKNITATFTSISNAGVTGYNLIDASTNQLIQPLVSGAVLNLATLPNRKLNIQAVTNPTIVGSVAFKLSGRQSKTRSDESGPHYSLHGDNDGDYSSWTPPVGNYTLKARTYTGPNGSGKASAYTTITFTVIDQVNATLYSLNVATSGSGTVAKSPHQTSYLKGSKVTLTAVPEPGYHFSGWSGDATGTSNPLKVTMNSSKNITATFTAIEVTSFNLINASTNQLIQPLVSGAVLNLATLPNRKLNIQAVTNPAIVGSVAFKLSGRQSKTRSDESGPHYSLQGDNNGDYSSWIPPVGSYTLKARTYTGPNGNGTASAYTTITFTIIDEAIVNTRLAAKGNYTKTVGEQDVKVSPNPFKDALILELQPGIKAEKATIALTTLVGKIVYQKEVSVHGNLQTIELNDLAALSSGLYLLRLQFDEKTIILKVVKQ